MAQSVILVRGTNGVSYATKHVVTSTDATNNGIVLDFRKNGQGSFRFDLVSCVQVVSSLGIPLTIVGLTITYPAPGKISISGTFTAGQVIQVIASAVKDSLTYSA